MFEQSILLPSEAPKRGRAFAASLTLQVAGVSLLLLIPAIYTERLPVFHPQLPALTFRVPGPMEDNPVLQQRPSSSVQNSILPSRKAFDPNQFRAGNAPSGVMGLIELPGAPDIGEMIERPGISTTADLSQLAVPAPPLITRNVQSPPVQSVPVRVPSDIQAAKLVRKVVPEYPQIAKIGRISGVVRLTGTIGRTGTVEQLQVVSGNPLLVKAAVDAVRRWVYQPTILNGVPVEVITSIDVVFTLAQ